MSTIDNPKGPADQEQVQQWLAQADAAAKAEDWDQTVALYRKALDFDRALQGVEAKLQWALRMRDIDKLYQQGKTKLDSGDYAGALADLRQARLKYASHYKDTDDLIVKAQSGMQKDKWDNRPQSRAAARKAQRQRSQRLALVVLGGIVLLVLLVIFFAAGGMSLFRAQTTSPDTSSGGGKGAAAALPPEKRADMYKSAPPMQIDPNKSYTATIVTAKGNIVVSLFAKDAPQHVNNFVFLARQGFYDGLLFHRVVRDPSPFVIQGGDPLGGNAQLAGTGGPGYTIPPELTRKHTRGALAMARRGGPAATTPSSGSQFYIALAPLPQLDGQYSVFGQATDESMAVADQIQVGDVIKTVTIEEK